MAYTSHKRGIEHFEHSWVSKVPVYMKNGMEAIAVAKSAFDMGKTIYSGFQAVSPYLVAGAALV
eukprot:7326993-Prorocentrum_lima.AAC.1